MFKYQHCIPVTFSLSSLPPTTLFATFVWLLLQTLTTPQDDWIYLDLQDTESYEDSYFIFKRNIGLTFLFSSCLMGSLLFGAFLVLIPNMRSLSFKYTVNSFMLDRRTGEGKIEFSKEEAGKRFNLHFAEATIEGSLQLCIQISTLISCSWVLTWLDQGVKQSKEPGHPLQFSDIWISIVMSLLSQSWA